MKQIPVEEAEEGMVLAADLSDSMDRIIMKEGAILTALYVKKLSRWGIELLCIESDDVDEASDEISDERIAAVEKLFGNLGERKYMMALKPIALGYEF